MEHASYNELEQTRGPEIRNLTITFLVLTSFSFALRIWSRCIFSAKNKFWWDDGLALVAWCCCVCEYALSLRAVRLGLGKHTLAIAFSGHATELLKIIYFAQIVMHLGICLTKLSALLFYRRSLTRHNRRFNIFWWITVAYTIVYTLFTLPTLIFACTTPKKYWLPRTPGHCITLPHNFTLVVVGLTLDVSSDLAILILPIPLLMRLQLPTQRKIGLVLAFVCGYAACIASIGRLASWIVLRPHLADLDTAWLGIPNIEWSLAEIGLSVFSINLPPWVHLFRRARNGGLRALITSQDLSALSNRANSKTTPGGKLTISQKPAKSPSSTHLFPGEHGSARVSDPDRRDKNNVELRTLSLLSRNSTDIARDASDQSVVLEDVQNHVIGKYYLRCGRTRSR